MSALMRGFGLIDQLADVEDPQDVYAQMTRNDYDQYLRDFRPFEEALLQARNDTSLIDQAREDVQTQRRIAGEVQTRNLERYGGAGLSNAQRQQQQRSLQRGGQLGMVNTVNNARIQQRQINNALLNELIDSIKRFKESTDVAICILDAGLSEDQKTELSSKVDEIKSAEWDIKVPDSKIKGREWLKSQVSRAFLPKYFPSYEKYLWIDCDAWVNDWQSVELYFKACENGKLGITQTIGPGYKITSRVNWVFGKLAIIKSQNFKHAIKSNISLEKARKLAFAPHINIGVFSLEKNSTCWNSWQENLKQTLKGGEIFGSEQLAMNMSVYVDNVETEFLPLNCNWITSNLLPKFDEDKDTWVEPYLPNYKIGIMHLAAGIWKDNEDMRLNKNIKIDIQTLTGKILNKSLRFNN